MTISKIHIIKSKENSEIVPAKLEAMAHSGSKSLVAGSQTKHPPLRVPTFPTLLSTPPPTADQDADSDVIAVVLTAFTVFTVVWDAASRLRTLQPPMRAMWPHIVRWGALLHPARGRLTTCRGRWSTGREVTGLAQAYMSIAEADPAYVRPFILENEDFAAQALELWLRFPRYVPRSAMDESGTSHAAIVVAHAVYNLLGNELKVSFRVDWT